MCPHSRDARVWGFVGESEAPREDAETSRSADITSTDSVGLWVLGGVWDLGNWRESFTRLRSKCGHFSLLSFWSIKIGHLTHSM